MREYLKPELEEEEFDIEDIITASGAGADDPVGPGPDDPGPTEDPEQALEEETVGVAPIDVIVDFN